MGRFETGQIVSLILLMPGLLGLYLMLPSYSMTDVLCYAALNLVVLLNVELELPSEIHLLFWLLLLGCQVGWKWRSHITSGMKYFYLSCYQLTFFYHWSSFHYWAQTFICYLSGKKEDQVLEGGGLLSKWGLNPRPNGSQTHDQVFRSSLNSWTHELKTHFVFNVCGYKVFDYHYSPQDLKHCRWRRRREKSSVKLQATNYEESLLSRWRNLFQVPKLFLVPIKSPEEAIKSPEEAIKSPEEAVDAPEEAKYERTIRERSKRRRKKDDCKFYSRTTVEMMLIFEMLLKFMLLSFRKKRKVFKSSKF